MGGSLESPATTVSSPEFTLGPAVDLLTHQRLSSAQLQVFTASTCSYGKIQYFKINLIFFFYCLISMEFTHTPCEQSYSAAFWLHRQHPPGMPTCTWQKQSRILLFACNFIDAIAILCTITYDWFR